MIILVFCNKCETENPEDAKYCQECGNEIKNDDKRAIEKRKSEEKSPIGALALNIIIAGAGFLYIQEYAKAVLSFIIVLIAGIISVSIGLSVLFGILALIFVMTWSYDETKKYNQRLNL